ncbi:MAG TPA: ABC transporter substrate-binding protein, partial [Methanospirillum sp.]|uniref:ABC transporter substrate-binding protein n=1 Tax=Methanospirillum sp. TaxID=45200 RepID=UPI002BBA6507
NYPTRYYELGIRMKKKVGVLFSCILSILLIGGAYAANITEIKPSDHSGQTITILDDRDQYITVPYPVKNVVFLVENAMNSMYAVGGADHISGIGSIWMPEKKIPFFKAIDPKFGEKPTIGSENGAVDLEALAKADPSLVVLWSADWNDETTTAIRETLKVPVYGVYYTKLSDVSRANDVFAKMIGNEGRAEEVSRIMANYTRRVTDKTGELQSDKRPTVYWMWGDILGTAGLNSATNDLITLAGGKNVLENANFEGKMLEHPTISLETLQKLNPDVIYMWYNEKIDPSDVMSGVGDFAGWKDLKAVKNGRVYEVTDPFVYDSFTPCQPLALMAIAKDLHPEIFKDINMDTLIDSFFVDMYGVHYPDYTAA